jgi:hypothetical protein
VKRPVVTRYQRGYLYEIPAILLALLVALALILPRLPIVWQKIALGVATVPILYCLFYLIVRPARTTAGQTGRGYARLALFLACAVAIVATAVAFILR